MQTFDFFQDAKKNYSKKFKFVEPEWLHFKGKEIVLNWIDPYVPQHSQLTRDALTILFIILMSRLIKKGLFRIWLDLRRRLGFRPYTRFQKKIRRDTRFYFKHEDRSDFVLMLYGLFEQHVLLYGFERLPCKRLERFFKVKRNFGDLPFRKYGIKLPNKKYGIYTRFDFEVINYARK